VASRTASPQPDFPPIHSRAAIQLRSQLLITAAGFVKQGRPAGRFQLERRREDLINFQRAGVIIRYFGARPTSSTFVS